MSSFVAASEGGEEGGAPLFTWKFMFVYICCSLLIYFNQNNDYVWDDKALISRMTLLTISLIIITITITTPKII